MAAAAGLIGKAVKLLVLLTILMFGVGLFFAWYVGAWNIIFPSSHHDTVAPILPTDIGNGALLVFSKTNSFRHAEGIEGGAAVIKKIAAKRGWGIYLTENGAVFNAAQLSQFSAVVFLNTTGDTLSEQQQSEFQQWLLAGNGWLGIHAAGDGSHADWQWYLDNLIGAEFTAHPMGPQFQIARVNIEQVKHPVIRKLPPSFDHEEEWYSWVASPRDKGFTILATLDESSYVPVQKIFGHETDLRMGDDHPVAWSNCVGLGRSIYMAMGHKAEAFSVKEVRILLRNSLAWVMDGKLGPCAPTLSFG